MAEIALYDTTLRDGTQREGLSLSGRDKLRIARRLDALGVAFIELGWPGSNPKDADVFERARDLPWQTAKLTAFGATRRAGLAPEDDPSLKALVAAGTEVVTIFGKTWTLHVTEVLRTSLEDNLAMIEDSVAWLGSQRRVIYDAEHFFDGHRADAGYALETLRAAVRGGAEAVVLCDTNGGSLPWDVEGVVAAMRQALGAVPLGIHCHDDGGLAVANSLAAVRAGATHVQGTVNGYGERCGNANLCAVIPDLELKMGHKALPTGRLRELSDVSHFVAEVANLVPDEHMAYVGRSAFAHKGGVHVAAMRRIAESYQHIDPALVGNRMRVVVSELSGRANVLSKAEELGIVVEAGVEGRVLADIKESEAAGAAYEAAEASVALLVARHTPGYVPPFEVLDYKVLVGHEKAGGGAFAEAWIKVRVDGRVELMAAEGDGPVEAMDRALRKALEPHVPEVARITLKDYKVRILDGRDGTAATTRVLIDLSDGARDFCTVGASQNILEASFRALVDGIEHGVTGLRGAPKAAPEVLS